MLINPFNTKIGLALGGGAAKGIAHLGVLQAFHERGIKINYLAGTSAGAVAAAYYAFHQDMQKVEKITSILRIKTVMNFKLSKMGLMGTHTIEKILLEDFGDINVENSPIPLAICATDLISGKAIYLTKGPLIKAIAASVAIPGIATPVEHQGRMLVDGGITDNVPLKALEQMGAGITVGVDLNGVPQYPQVENIFDVISNSIDIAIDSRTKDHMKRATVPISLDLSKYSLLDNFEIKKELIEMGYQTASKEISKVFRHQRFNLFYYFKELLNEVMPLKIPNFLKELLNKF